MDIEQNNEQIDEQISYAYDYSKPNMQSDNTTQEDTTYHYSYVNDNKEEPKVSSKSSKKWIAAVCLAVVFGLVASVVFQASNRVIEGIFGKEEKSIDKVITTTQTSSGNTSAVVSNVAEVAKNVMPSVVSITNLSVQEVQNFFFGGITTQEQKSSGSGIIVGQSDTELLIVTNNHVIEASTSLTVTFDDGKSVEAKVKGTDADIDIAVIAIPLAEIAEDTLDSVKVATLGDSDALVVGEPAIAIGNALGYGQSVTEGIVSALERELEDFDSKLIQTDAAINPGNSGGALLNAKGEVIGINTVKVNADAVEGMGYAIPISDVNDIINELMNRETREKVEEAKRGTLGIEGISVGAEYSELYGIPKGVQIATLLEGGAAEKAGLPKRSIITKFDGNSIDSMEELQGHLEYYKAGETVEVVAASMNQEGEYVEKTYEVTLGSRAILNR